MKRDTGMLRRMQRKLRAHPPLIKSGPIRFHKQESGGFELDEPAWIVLPFDAPEFELPSQCLACRKDPYGRSVLHFFKGFEWDGASVPWGTRADEGPQAWAPFGHDGGYRAIKYDVWPDELRLPVDRLFYRQLSERRLELRSESKYFGWLFTPMKQLWWGVRAPVWYMGVRIGGKKASQERAEDTRYVGH